MDTLLKEWCWEETKHLALEAVVDNGKNKIGDEVYTEQDVDYKKYCWKSWFPENLPRELLPSLVVPSEKWCKYDQSKH